MRKYFTIFQIAWQNVLEYRANFFIGRLRNIILLLTLYYLWTAVFADKPALFGFTAEQIVTYVFLVNIFRALILNSRTADVGGEIVGGGKFFSYLLRPISYFKYWFSIDVAYKIFDLVAAIFEVAIFLLILKITVFLQVNPLLLFLTLISIVLAILIFFFLSFIISLSTFWTDQPWPGRFVFEVFLGFAVGTFFPLDVLPRTFIQILNLTPFPYLLYFPANIYLGRLETVQIFQGLAMQIFWLFAAYFLTKLLWIKGLKVFSAMGA